MKFGKQSRFHLTPKPSGGYDVRLYSPINGTYYSVVITTDEAYQIVSLIHDVESVRQVRENS